MPRFKQHTDPFVLVDSALQHEVEQFLYLEAELLDDWKFDDWLKLFTEDVHYWMPTRSNRLLRERHLEVSAANEIAFFDETYVHLQQRLDRLATGLAWSEEPPTRTRHLLTNFRIRPVEDNADELDVKVNFLLYANRLEKDVNLFAGEFTNRLRRSPDTLGGWQISRRKIVLDQSTLLAGGLSIFF